jgi:hypothetical protein
MEIIKFKVPLTITMETSSGFGDGYKDVLLSELDKTKIHWLGRMYDCQFNWLTEDGVADERDKNCMGFDGSEVIMTATLKGFDYFIEVLSDKPFNAPVTFHKFGGDKIVTMTLKEAVIFALEGQLSDGIGENEIGYIKYDGEEYSVWLGDLVEI